MTMESDAKHSGSVPGAIYKKQQTNKKLEGRFLEINETMTQMNDSWPNNK